MVATCSLPFLLLTLSYSTQLRGNFTDNERAYNKKSFLSANERLFKHVFTDYNPNLPPFSTISSRNHTGRYSVEPEDEIFITLMYAKLLELSAPRQLMTVIFEYAMTWMDDRLTWNPEDFGGISHIYVLRSNVWVPDITPFDSVEVVDTRPDYKQHVTIRYKGLTSFYTSVVTSVVCPIDVTSFPFDWQNCSIKLLSYSFYSEHIEMEAGLYPSVNVDTVGNDEWEVTSIIPHSEVRYNDSDMVQVNEYTFRLKRNPSYYIALIIIPSFMLTFLCVAGLFTSPLQVDDLDKFSMGLTTIMSTTVMIGIVAENIPKTKQAPQLTTYVTTNLIIVSVAIMLVIITPKITQFFSWIARRRQIHILRTYGYLANGVMNATFLLIFEGYVSKNLYDLVALKYAKK